MEFLKKTGALFPLRTLRQQSNFLSATQAVSNNSLEADWAAIFQWKVMTRNICDARRVLICVVGTNSYMLWF